MDASLSPVVTAKTLCEMLAISRPTLSRMQLRGDVPPTIRIPGGRAIRWLRSDVEAWIAANREVQA